jgi:hypothetical protein
MRGSDQSACSCGGVLGISTNKEILGAALTSGMETSDFGPRCSFHQYASCIQSGFLERGAALEKKIGLENEVNCEVFDKILARDATR